MPLQPPNLDDTNYEKLRTFARKQIESNLQVEWNDLSPGDPGIVLLEAFAYLTDQMIYRLNRLPDKVYVSLLRLLGVTLYPPVAAAVELVFTNETEAAITVPAGTQVTTGEGGDDAPIFITNVEIEVPGREGDAPGTAAVWARHCVVVDGEVVGTGTGDPGLSVAVQHPPIVAPTHDGLDLRVQTVENGRRVEWEEKPSFSNLSADSRAFVVDRPAGIIRFAPAARLTEMVEIDEEEEARQSRRLTPLAATPPKEAPILVSYPHGGGADGNVVAGVLATILADSTYPALQQLAVTNPRPASGGQDMETLPEALTRGPQEVYSLERAITARDFEQLAATGDGIARATAFTQAGRWRHGTRGTVEIHLVPQLPRPGADVETVTAAKRAEGEDAWEIKTLREMLADSQPLGTTVALHWVNYKKVWVEAAVVIRERQSEAEARERLEQALRALINPLGKGARTGRWQWDFGQPFYASDAYRVILDDPAVERVTRLNLCAAAAPDEEVRTIAADFHQPHTWYAGSAAGGTRTLFRSFNDGESWEAAPAFPPPADEALRETVDHVRPNPDHPGLVVAWVHQHDANGALHQALPFVSTDCGESWHELPAFANGRVEDVAWIARGDVPIMLLATDQGLYKLELALVPGQAPAGRYAQVREMSHPLYAVAVLEKDGQVYVAVARKSRGGVYLANGVYLAYDIDLDWYKQDTEDVNAATTGPQLFQLLTGDPRPGAEEAIGLQDEDVRTLTVQVDEEHGRVFLWAGAMGMGWDADRENPIKESGGNAFCWEVETPQPLLGQWVAFPRWTGGSCRDVAFAGRVVLAATQWGGVLRLDTGAENPAWEQTNSVVLPRRQTDVQRDFAPVTTLAANRDWIAPLAIAGGAQGLYLTADGGRSFTVSSRTCFDYKVALPENWLFVSGAHVIETRTQRGEA